VEGVLGGFWGFLGGFFPAGFYTGNGYLVWSVQSTILQNNGSQILLENLQWKKVKVMLWSYIAVLHLCTFKKPINRRFHRRFKCAKV
jgi:hypothetical protein